MHQEVNMSLERLNFKSRILEHEMYVLHKLGFGNGGGGASQPFVNHYTTYPVFPRPSQVGMMFNENVFHLQLHF